MAKTIIDRAYAYANGALLGMCDSVGVEYVGDPIPVETLVQDFAGVYPPPKHATLSFESFVPTTGLEFDAIKMFLATTEVQFKVQLGGSGKSVTTSGFVMAPSITSTPSAPTKMSFNAVVDAKPFE